MAHAILYLSFIINVNPLRACALQHNNLYKCYKRCKRDKSSNNLNQVYQMKLRMLNSYLKFRELKDAQGNVILDKETQKVKGNLVTLWRYAVCDATPQELALYKKFKTQDGKNYYREEKIGNKTYPLWHGDYLGREVTLRSYTRQDGKLGF